jgi:CelD/BcsL family acetyltransferase involved in cellulose biosynthesis
VKAAIRLAIHTRIPEDPFFAEQWNVLVHAMERPQVFYSYEWSSAVSRAYPSPAPLLYCAYRGEELIGIASLAVDWRRQAAFLTEQTADYCDFVSAPADRAELIRLVFAHLRASGIEDLRLANLPADSASTHTLRSAGREFGYSTFSRLAYSCARIELNSLEQRSHVAASARRNSKKTRNALAAMGQVSLDHRKTWEEFSGEFPEFAAANVGRFLSEGRISNLIPSERRQFLAELARVLSGRKWLTMSTLKLEGRTIAWQLGFQFANTWLWYLPAFDMGFQQLHPGPGTYLQYQILQEASRQPEIHAIDLGLGNEGYKRQYANSERPTLHWTVTTSKTRLGLQICRYKSAELAKKSSRVERVARSCQARVARLRALSTLPGGLSRIRLLLRKAIFDDVEIFFLEKASQERAQNCDLKLVQLSTRLLAINAMEYHRESGVLEYLTRSALRLKSGEDQGFALLSQQGIPVHICWAAPFEGFRMPDLDRPLREPAPDSVVLFDCWTAPPQLSPQPEAKFASIIAAHILESGKRPWVFNSGRQLSTWERAGFVLRFSLVRRKKLSFNRASAIEFKGEAEDGILGLYPAA